MRLSEISTAKEASPESSFSFQNHLFLIQSLGQELFKKNSRIFFVAIVIDKLMCSKAMDSHRRRQFSKSNWTRKICAKFQR